jgi:hypothetical protein
MGARSRLYGQLVKPTRIFINGEEKEFSFSRISGRSYKLWDIQNCPSFTCDTLRGPRMPFETFLARDCDALRLRAGQHDRSGPFH